MSTVATPCILIVDDEPMIRRFLRLLLEQSGFAVLDAGNGIEALSVFQLHRESIGLVLTDVVMPEMNGPTLVDHIRHIDPCVPVLFISAYCETLSGAMKNIECLPKPFLPDELIQKVQQAVHSYTPLR
jgi:two-component system cell cycle sensor histidine kinase/response regulator CckA